jgi:hypothetical protein
MASKPAYEAEYGGGEVQHEHYCMPTEYKKNTEEMNRMTRYPAWNAKADTQSEYPDAKMEGSKIRKQEMGKGM